jgi:hypothetical protein
MPLLGWLEACSGKLPDATLVEGVRVLGVQAEPPEAVAGDTVTLRALVANPKNEELTLTWYACLVTERGSGFFSDTSAVNTSGGGGYSLDDPGSCAERHTAGLEDAVLLGTGETASFAVPADLLDDPAVVNLAYGLPASTELPEIARTLLLTFAGVNMTVTLVVESPSETIEAFKRVNISTGLDANQNPGNLAFHLALADDEAEPPKTGTPPGAQRCFTGEETAPKTLTPGSWAITPLNLPDPPPSYGVILGGTTTEEPFVFETRDETLFYSFFSTTGGFSSRIQKSTAESRVTFGLGEDEVGETLNFWIVARDGRGGTAWCHSVVSVEARAR